MISTMKTLPLRVLKGEQSSILSFEMVQETEELYDWCIKQVTLFHKDLETRIYPMAKLDEQLYFEALYADCIELYKEEFRDFIMTLISSLSNSSLQPKLIAELKKSRLFWEEKWLYLLKDMASVEEAVNLFQWLVEFPYLLDKQLSKARIISN
ncbi:hypothetical protein CVD28_08935 [Bacillus sp. M6-12]|uniref:hypothetical protein n=1 Tax=Bacillus sp. M6-12 TaxID=2054166 RepID=UPI000C768B39|nr:hypothetical protein [Bacillus sp. M6-12]PLS17814.1 hypothetical protein CVD28_08935 [Bacillus sp. M6-12]